jgi:beta-lactamase regulating signal transducer with metallopeptidase domain
VDTLVDLGLSNALVATAWAVPVAAVVRLCRRPALAHALWLLVLLKLLTPDLVPVPLPRPVGWEAAVSAPEATAPGPAPEAPSAPVPSGAEIGPVEDHSDESLPPDPPAPVALEPVTPEPAPVPAVSGKGPTWRQAVGAIWLAGAVTWWAAAGVHLGRFRRLLRAARPAPEAVQAQARRLADRLGRARCPGVWLVPAPVSPMLWALLGAPRLLLPEDLWGRLSGPQRDSLLAHELAHLRRRDHWVRRFEFVVGGLYWWHPLVWWALRAVQDAAEECCDAWVVWALPDAAPAYAETLLETAAFLSQARSAVPVGASGVGPVPLLKRRLTMILRGPTGKALPRAGTLAVLGLGAVLLPLQPGWGQSEPPAGGGASLGERPDLVVSPQGQPRGGDQLGEARQEVQRLLTELRELRDRMQAVEERLRRAQERLGVVEGRPGDVAPALPRGGGGGGAPRAPRPTPGSPLPGAAPRPMRGPANAAPLPPGPGGAPDVPREPPAPGGAGGGDRPRQPGAGRPGTPVAPGTVADQPRFQDLDRKLDALLREIEALRREVRAHQQPGGPTPAPAPGARPQYK